MSFLDFWSTSSDLYSAEEGLKDVGTKKTHFSHVSAGLATMTM